MVISCPESTGLLAACLRSTTGNGTEITAGRTRGACTDGDHRHLRGPGVGPCGYRRIVPRRGVGILDPASLHLTEPLAAARIGFVECPIRHHDVSYR